MVTYMKSLNKNPETPRASALGWRPSTGRKRFLDTAAAPGKLWLNGLLPSPCQWIRSGFIM